MRRRIAVTGLGLVSPHGDVPDAVFADLLAGRSAVAPWPGELPDPVVAAVAPFEVERWFTRLQLSGVDRVSQIAVAAAESARQDAGWERAPEAAGIYVGTGMGGAAALNEAYRRLHDGARLPPLTIPAYMANAAAAQIAMRTGVRGPVINYSVACASSALAIAEAAKAIAVGEVDWALAGGSEALLVPGVVRAWQALQTLAPPLADAPERSCRPFAADRAGLVLGEGAAFMVLEPLEAARARGARIHAEYLGGGISCDASHLTKPDAGGQVLALNAALRSSGLRPADIGYCNAHGTATRVGDAVEAESLRRVWGDAIGDLAVSSTKALHGHLLGAAGALEALITVLAVRDGALPPNGRGETPDAEIGLRLVAPGATAAPQLRAALSNSFAFGGTNAVLAFGRAD